MRKGELVVHSGGDAMSLLVPSLAGLEHEHVLVAFLDADQRLLRLSEAFAGSEGGIDLPVRRIVQEALDCGAAGLILAHNHPSGDPTPSAADLSATRVLADTIRVLGIRLLDHLIVGNGDVASFRAMGLL